MRFSEYFATESNRKFCCCYCCCCRSCCERVPSSLVLAVTYPVRLHRRSRAFAKANDTYHTENKEKTRTAATTRVAPAPVEPKTARSVHHLFSQANYCLTSLSQSRKSFLSKHMTVRGVAILSGFKFKTGTAVWKAPKPLFC